MRRKKNTTNGQSMRLLRIIMLVLAGLSLAACSSKFKTYNGPEITSIQVHKADRKMYLLHGDKVIETYKVHLGGDPIGPKQFEGDGKTPEGTYYISRKNPKSTYHLSLGVSYPNNADRAFAAANGKSPGGDIMIHGGPPLKANGKPRKTKRYDWTAGCIAVTDREIERIYSMIGTGVPITIFP
jgi:murein L,D-transpeptidase YafK